MNIIMNCLINLFNFIYFKIEESKETLTINTKQVEIDYLADYLLRLGYTQFTEQTTKPKLSLSEGDFLVLLESIPGISEQEVKKNFDILCNSSYYKKSSFTISYVYVSIGKI